MKSNFRAVLGVLFIFLILGTGLAISFAIILTTNRNTKPIDNPLDGSLNDSKNNQLYLLNAPLKDLKELVIRRLGQEDLIFKPKSPVIIENKKAWSLVNPIIENPDDKKIIDYISRILNLKLDNLIETFDNIDTLHLSEYGFDKPYIIVTANTKDSSKIFMVGDKIEDERYPFESRYVYSDQYRQLGILSTSLPLLTQDYGYFNQNINILNDLDNLLYFNFYDFTEGKEYSWHDLKNLEIKELLEDLRFHDYKSLFIKASNQYLAENADLLLSFTLKGNKNETFSKRNIYFFYDTLNLRWEARIQYSSFKFVVENELIDRLKRLLP